MRPIPVTLFLLFALALAALPAHADQDPFGRLAVGETAAVGEVIDGDTVALADGRQVRLVGIQAPKLPLGRPGFGAWPLAGDAKAALESLTRGRRVTLGYGGLRVDRHGRQLAHLFTDDGVWVQGALLEHGLARVYSFPDNRALVPEMLALEGLARATRRGIWALDFYAVLDAGKAAARSGEFALVEGKVHDVAVVRGRAYLNFGADWKSDFTVTIAPEDLAAFTEAGVRPEGYEGRSVRVRGWLRSHNGPLIEATHPEQIEVLSR